jgi:hypothetical protein
MKPKPDLPINELNEIQLREILITCDGHGKDVKEDVVNEIERRAYERGIIAGIPDKSK